MGCGSSSNGSYAAERGSAEKVTSKPFTSPHPLREGSSPHTPKKRSPKTPTEPDNHSGTPANAKSELEEELVFVGTADEQNRSWSPLYHSLQLSATSRVSNDTYPATHSNDFTQVHAISDCKSPTADAFGESTGPLEPDVFGFAYEVPGAIAAEGSSSTTRLSVTSNSCSEVERTIPAYGGRVQLPFFSSSIFAPHTAADMMEIQKRIYGGYTDADTGLMFLTPSQRWDMLLQESVLLHEVLETPRTNRRSFSMGSGLLWVNPKDGLPAPLECPLNFLLLSFANSNHGGRLHKKNQDYLVSSLARSLPDLEESLLDAEIAQFTIDRCALRVKEYVAWAAETAPFNPNHQRLRAILGQLQVSLRDTAILLEDPQRYLEAFARIDPQGLMFQAEVLSLQDSNPGGKRKSPFVDSLNPLQEAPAVPIPVSARKAKELLNWIKNPNSSRSSEPRSPIDFELQQLQWNAAVTLFRKRAFLILRYILVILQVAVSHR